MQLFIEPDDVWLFRDGRSFSAGSDHRAESLFPPLPTVMQGALRSHYLVVLGVELANQAKIEAAVGTATNYKNFCLRGPLIMKEDTRYYPSPADAVTVSKNDQTLRSLRPRPLPDGVKTSTPTPQLLWDEEEPQKGEAGLWLSESELQKYLKTEVVTATPSSELFERESRPGTEIDPKRQATAEGLLYQAEFIRPYSGVGLWVDCEGFDGWPSNGLLRLGGEARAGYFKQLPEAPKPILARAGQALPNQFKLYFATPTYFAGGWQPEGGDWQQHFTGPVTLQAATLSRYLSVGGYDWAKRYHKAAYRYIPAGSVYYFSANQPVELKQDWVCDSTPDNAKIGQIGFGQVVIAAWE